MNEHSSVLIKCTFSAWCLIAQTWSGLYSVISHHIDCQTPRRQYHSISVLNRLHWLPVHDRVDYKIAFLCYNNLHILLVYSRHIDSRVTWGHLRLTYGQHSLHQQTLLLVSSHVVPRHLEQSSLILQQHSMIGWWCKSIHSAHDNINILIVVRCLFVQCSRWRGAAESGARDTRYRRPVGTVH